MKIYFENCMIYLLSYSKNLEYDKYIQYILLILIRVFALMFNFSLLLVKHSLGGCHLLMCLNGSMGLNVVIV